MKELKGFKKVWIAAGETEEVMFELGREELQVFSGRNKYELEKGYFVIETGNPVYLLLFNFRTNKVGDKY